jgi:hypothetical protein
MPQSPPGALAAWPPLPSVCPSHRPSIANLCSPHSSCNHPPRCPGHATLALLPVVCSRPGRTSVQVSPGSHRQGPTDRVPTAQHRVRLADWNRARAFVRKLFLSGALHRSSMSLSRAHGLRPLCQAHMSSCVSHSHCPVSEHMH